jgi:hypothetical protein
MLLRNVACPASSGVGASGGKGTPKEVDLAVPTVSPLRGGTAGDQVGDAVPVHVGGFEVMCPQAWFIRVQEQGKGASHEP